MNTNTFSMMHGQYLPIQLLGSGTYGQVMRCTDTMTGNQVAVKIAHRDPAYQRSALNEIRAMQLLSDDDDTLQLLSSFEENGHICIVSELLHKNLYEVLSGRGFQPLSINALGKISERVLRALGKLHKNGYIHCDIKPENIMLRRPPTVEDRADDEYGTTCLIDFGAVRLFHENTYFDVQSLWYRAPEVLLGVPYTPMIDSWSVGCLLFELYTGKPLFPGDNPQKQLANIVRTVGMPPLEMMTTGANAAKMHLSYIGRDIGSEADLCCHISNYRGNASMLQSANVNEEGMFMNLLCQLLNPDPLKRLGCADALYHPFLRIRQQRQQCGPNSSVLLNSREKLLRNSPYNVGPSSVGEDAQSITCFEQSHPSRNIAGDCNNIPATVVGNPASVFVSTPLQPHAHAQSQAQTTASIMSPRRVFVQRAVYTNPPTAVVQSVPFHLHPQPLPPPPPPQLQKSQHLQPQPSRMPPVPMPYPCQHHPQQSMNPHQQNSINVCEYPVGHFQQALLQIMPFFNGIDGQVHPSMLPHQAYAAQPLSCGNTDRQGGNRNVFTYGIPVLDSGRGVVYASS